MLIDVNVICIKWGTFYTHKDVNRLYHGARKNISDKYKLNFYCFTEDESNINKNIIIKPLPKMNIDPKNLKYAYQKEAGLCDDDLGGLSGQRVLFFDLDTIIINNIDCFFEYQINNQYYALIDFNHGKKIGSSAVYSWKVGTLGYIKENFEINYQKIYKKYYTAAQEYLTDKVIEKYNEIFFWPEDWCVGFKKHCLPKWYLRYFISPKLPIKTKVLCFQGAPKLEDAINGIWCSAKDYNPSFWKKIYKKILPSPWLKQYIIDED